MFGKDPGLSVGLVWYLLVIIGWCRAWRLTASLWSAVLSPWALVGAWAMAGSLARGGGRGEVGRPVRREGSREDRVILSGGGGGTWRYILKFGKVLLLEECSVRLVLRNF